MKILPKVYKSVTEEPFRVEKYKDSKVEFYYLENTPNLIKYASKGRFAVWTSNGEDYRVLVESGYYEECSELYANSINDIWLDYTHFVYSTQRKIGKKYNFISLGITFVILAIVLAITALKWLDESTAFLVGMALLFVVVFLVSSNQQKKITAEVQLANRKATTKIKNILGAKGFEKLLQKQSNYYYKYMELDIPDEALEAASDEEQAGAIEAEAVEVVEEVKESKEDLNE